MKKMMRCEHDFGEEQKLKTINLKLLIFQKCKKCEWYKYRIEELEEDDKEI